MAPADEARQHLQLAEKALKTSAWSLKFSPDHLTASMEYTQAATLFRAANMLRESADCWLKAAEAKEQQRDLFGAGRAYESAGGVCESIGSSASAEATQHWEKAVDKFRLSGKGDIATKLLQKLAAAYEKSGSKDRAQAAYEGAIDVIIQDEKDYNLADAYKAYIGFLVRSEMFEEALKAIDGHIEALMRQRHFPFVHKEMLSKIVILLHLQDTVRADEAVNPPSTVPEGWYLSKECKVGSELVAAFQENDVEGVEKLVKDQTFTFIQVEVARMVRKLRIPGASRPAPAAGAGVAGVARSSAAAQQQEDEEQEPADNAALLM